MIQWMLTFWSLVLLSFLNPAWTSGSSQFTYCWILSWRILNITLIACEMSTVEHSLALPFFGIRIKADLFQSCGHCWVFQMCWNIECSTFIASSFTIWSSSTEILSPPLALFMLMLLNNTCIVTLNLSNDTLNNTCVICTTLYTKHLFRLIYLIPARTPTGGCFYCIF